MADLCEGGNEPPGSLKPVKNLTETIEAGTSPLAVATSTDAPRPRVSHTVLYATSRMVLGLNVLTPRLRLWYTGSRKSTGMKFYEKLGDLQSIVAEGQVTLPRCGLYFHLAASIVIEGASF
ncbi:hypothetical protein ANN_01104 [Periplaneta americana]|uniref:Uncharacterized protein n=1 Tax=Periplaneta americana TaxID=6978 RepID=A0ABQ8TWN9_PERAM|nr:hypothetical protein ANN_01104 [Periplaneta americana]